MKEEKKINLSTLENKLSDGEMKEVLGRNGYCQADVDCVLGASCINGVCGGGCATPCLITGNGNAACATLQDGQNLANRGFAVNCCLPNACCN